MARQAPRDGPSVVTALSHESNWNAMSRFVVLAPNRWDCVWMNRQQIFSRLGQRHFVLYSTGALNLRQRRCP